MSLLDDMERMAQPGIASYCDFCTGSPVSRHFEGCPLLAIPKIVAVLEAAERILNADEGLAERQRRDREAGWGRTTAYIMTTDPLHAEKQDAYDALRAAMQGGKGQA